jgi:hypothetical protein
MIPIIPTYAGVPGFPPPTHTLHTLGCDFFERVGEKRIDIRRFLGYVCQIAKVRVHINFGWVSLFTQKYVKCDFFGHMRIST